MHDCTLFPAGWIISRRGLDLASLFRGAYSTADECRALLKREGGLLRLVSKQAARCGLPATAEPSLGDVGVVKAQVAVIRERPFIAPVSAICMGRERWAVLSERGVSVAPFPILAAWSV